MFHVALLHHRRLASLAVTLALLPAVVFCSTATALEARIIQGAAVSIEDHPYQVRVLIARGQATAICGGSIRDATHVVTAAHCVVDENSFYPSIVSPANVQVGYSSADQTTLLSVQVQRVSVAPAYLREETPASDAAVLTSDAAVLTLANPIDLANDPEAEAIPFASDTELDTAFRGGAPAFATGWGATAEGGSSSRFLQGVDLPIRSNAACQAVYGQDYDGSVMICAGGTGTAPSGNKDTCQGDSGGPLAIDTNPNADVVSWELVGITSFGNGCGRANTPGAYAWVQSSVLRPFLEAASPAPPPSSPSSNPTITGTLRVGSTVRCNAPPVSGANPARYLWLVVDGNNFTVVETTTAPTLTLPAATLGAFLVCDVRYESPGGFAYSDTPGENRVGPVLAALPPSGGGPAGGTTTPPPVAVADTTRPRASIARVRCLRGRCTIKVNATDVGGLVQGLSAKVTYKVKRCRRVGGRRRCRSVKKTKKLRPTKTTGGFTITARLKPAKYSMTAVATDTAGNRSSTARRTFRVKRAR